MASLPLAISVGTTDTTITVLGTIQNASGSGTIVIESEHISYTGNTSTQFLNCTRGTDSTSAAAHAAGVQVTYTQNPVVTLPIPQSGVTPIPSYPWTTITTGENVVEIQDFGAPTNAVTGKDIAPIGSRYTNKSNGTLYLNTGTQASPVWTLLQEGTDLGITQLTGDVTAGPGNGSQVASISSATVTGKLLTGYVSGAGTVAATDTILQGIDKLNGNIVALGSPITALTGDVTASGPGSVGATIANGHVTPAKISTANTDLFVFPAQVTVNQAPGGVFSGDATLVLKGASVDSYLTVDNLNRVFLLNGGKGFRLDSGLNLNLLTDLDGNGNNIKTAGVLAAGTTVPDVTAQLDVTSTTKGLLPPRMTTTQKNAISTPAEGLMVYDLTLHKLCVWTGSTWETVTSA